MSDYDLIDVVASGKFVKTLFGESSSSSPKTLDVYTPASVDAELFDSSIGEPPVNTNEYNVVRAEGQKRIEADPAVQKLIAQKGTNVSEIMAGLVNEAPRNVDTFGDLFDDGSVSVEDVQTGMARLKESLPPGLYDTMDSEALNNSMRFMKEFDEEQSSNGCEYGDSLKAKQRFSSGSSSGGETDPSSVMSYLASMAAGAFSDSVCADVLGGIDSMQDTLGLSDEQTTSVKKKAAKYLSKYGGKSQVEDLLEDVGIDKLTPQEKKQVSKALSGNYVKRPNLKSEDYASEGESVVNLLGKLDSAWDTTTDALGRTVVDGSVYSDASDDLKEVWLSTPSQSTRVACFGGAGRIPV